jgi:RNA polymerase sigma-70 factor (ECF subfamily)
MAKSPDEEPRSEPTASDPSAPVDTATQGDVERGSASNAAPKGAPRAAVPDYAASSSFANLISDPPGRDDYALREIVKQHRPYLVELARRLTGNKGDAEDLVQDTFRRALPHFDQLRPDSRVRAWLAKILTRRFLDYNKHEDVVERALPKLAVDDVVTDSVAPESAHAALQAAIEQLEPQLREIIEYHLAGMSYKQIADKLDIPIGTVSSRMKRARDRLKELLTPTGVLK